MSCAILAIVAVGFSSSQIVGGGGWSAEDISRPRRSEGGVRRPWNSLEGWNKSTPHCWWVGVGCDELGRVVSRSQRHEPFQSPFHCCRRPARPSMSTAVNSLSGPIPLSFLAFLISATSISPTTSSMGFPSTLSRLKNLLSSTYNNNLTGSLLLKSPTFEIFVIFIFGNFFTGVIPWDYGGWGSSSIWRVSGNELGGRMPPEMETLATFSSFMSATSAVTRVESRRRWENLQP
ncbi:hypothetical protein HPP92_024670 [Vanilla planifolia]|uniref:Leucine-rich repeat-containing N-terminal plant-type domain-containing protein n=1 Tax=Vanilla planifolia TaxID=51239 RepID=A0A835PQC3_VANPL|nr:hypothetical protein HPP92_024964 [Vanilla planifolia]KAG0456882.1 hypothetical protein HPP92_024670 [Vanilla planifolia]